MTTEKLTTTIYNLTTGEVVTRDLNNAEITQYEKDQEDYRLKKIAETKKEAERTAILEKLGITAEEAAALLS